MEFGCVMLVVRVCFGFTCGVSWCFGWIFGWCCFGLLVCWRLSVVFFDFVVSVYVARLLC